MDIINSAICDPIFSSKASMKNHIALVHEKKKSFRCSICDQSFSQKQIMKDSFTIVILLLILPGRLKALIWSLDSLPSVNTFINLGFSRLY